MSPYRAARHQAWAVVAFAAVSLSAVVALLTLTPASDSRVGTAVVTILGILGPVVAATYGTIRRLEQQHAQLSATRDTVERTGRKLDEMADHMDEVETAAAPPPPPRETPPSPRPPA